MKTGTRNLIVVAGCIVVLGGVTAALLLTGNKEAATASSAVSTGTIELVSKTSEDIVSMAVTNQKGSYTLLPMAAAVSSSAASGTASTASGTASAITYEIKGLKGVPINTEATGQVVQNGFSLNATKNLGTVDDLDQFGLKTPQAKVEVTFKDGSTYNYKIGNASATDSTAYYMCGENSNNVYIVSIDSGILESENYFVNKTVLSITNASGTNDFTTIKLSGTNFPSPITIKKDGTVNAITSPVNAQADSTTIGTVETALASLTADSVAAVSPDAAALKSYGLDKPAAVAEFTVNKGSYKLLIGAQKDSSYYAMLDKVNVVYLVKADSVSAWVATNAFALRDKSLLMPDITSVKSLAVAVGGTNSTLTVARTKDETKSTQDKPVYSYKVTGTGGTAIDFSTNYTEFYKSIIGVQLLEAADKKPAGNPDLNVEFQYFDKSGKDTVAFYKDGDRRYIAVVNGSVYGTVTSADAEKIISDLKLLESGKTVS
jgi:hypothetical protein